MIFGLEVSVRLQETNNPKRRYVLATEEFAPLKFWLKNEKTFWIVVENCLQTFVLDPIVYKQKMKFQIWNFIYVVLFAVLIGN